MSKLDTVFGIHAVESLLSKDPARIKRLIVMKGRDDRRLQGLLQIAGEHNIPYTLSPRRELDDLVRGRHQGVVALVEPTAELNENDLDTLLDGLDEPPFLLILDSVTDPHNLGACLRSADAAGVHAVITPKDKAAPLNAVARNVASGAAEAVPLVRVTNLARTMRALQERGIWINGAAGEGESTIYQVDFNGPMAIAMGAEGSGLRRLTREHCDQLTKIPMVGSVSSLNVSVATGVFLFEALRQRSSSK
jgi:23S rRNA (guanosine2251-2'-O)-methyltransferase